VIKWLKMFKCLHNSNILFLIFRLVKLYFESPFLHSILRFCYTKSLKAVYIIHSITFIENLILGSLLSVLKYMFFSTIVPIVSLESSPWPISIYSCLCFFKYQLNSVSKTRQTYMFLKLRS